MYLHRVDEKDGVTFSLRLQGNTLLTTHSEKSCFTKRMGASGEKGHPQGLAPGRHTGWYCVPPADADLPQALGKFSWARIKG